MKTTFIQELDTVCVWCEATLKLTIRVNETGKLGQMGYKTTYRASVSPPSHHCQDVDQGQLFSAG